jgi:hypothetical protein
MAATLVSPDASWLAAALLDWPNWWAMASRAVATESPAATTADGAVVTLVDGAVVWVPG